MIQILVSAVIFCVGLKLTWATLGLSAKFITVALYVVIVYVLTVFFFERPGNLPKAEKVLVNDSNRRKS